jgi:hypothetical protein
MILLTKSRDYYPMVVGVVSAKAEDDLGYENVTVVIQPCTQIIRASLLDMWLSAPNQ